MAANAETMMYVSARPRRQHAPPEHEKLRGKQLKTGKERPCRMDRMAALYMRGSEDGKRAEKE